MSAKDLSVEGTSGTIRKADSDISKDRMPKRQRTEVKVEDEPAGSASTRSTRSIVKPDDRDPRLELLSDGVRLRRDTKTKVLTPSGSTTDLNVRSTCLEIDSSSARKQWPVLNISFERGVLRIMARSPADILAEAAISYTATFATEQASLFDCLLAGITGGKHGVVTLKFFKTVLEKDSGFLCYLVITILLAFTKATLQDTVTEFLRRVNKVKPAAATIAAVSSDYAERAKGILEKEVAKASTSVDSLNETLLVHLLGDLVECQDPKVTSWMRQASLMAETNSPVNDGHATANTADHRS